MSMIRSQLKNIAPFLILLGLLVPPWGNIGYIEFSGLVNSPVIQFASSDGPAGVATLLLALVLLVALKPIHSWATRSGARVSDVLFALLAVITATEWLLVLLAALVALDFSHVTHDQSAEHFMPLIQFSPAFFLFPEGLIISCIIKLMKEPKHRVRFLLLDHRGHRHAAHQK